MQFSYLSKGSSASPHEPVTGSNPIILTECKKKTTSNAVVSLETLKLQPVAWMVLNTGRPIWFCDGSCAGFPSVILRDATCCSVHLSSPVCAAWLCILVCIYRAPWWSVKSTRRLSCFNGNKLKMDKTHWCSVHPYILITLMLSTQIIVVCLGFIATVWYVPMFSLFLSWLYVPAYVVSVSDHRCVY